MRNDLANSTYIVTECNTQGKKKKKCTWCVQALRSPKKRLLRSCNHGVRVVKNVRSWVRQFKECRTSCDVERSSSKVS